MISKTEFEVLSALLESKPVDDNAYGYVLRQLLADKLICYNVVSEDETTQYYNGYIVLPKGNRAYEEYLAFQTDEARKDETLGATEEANRIAEKANELSSEANLIARKAKRLSLVALIVSVTSVAVAIVGIVLASLSG